jgi:hypothetical protein
MKQFSYSKSLTVVEADVDEDTTRRDVTESISGPSDLPYAPHGHAVSRTDTLDKQARRGAVLPVDIIEYEVEGPRLQVWLDSPATPFYVMHVVGNWYSERT